MVVTSIQTVVLFISKVAEISLALLVAFLRKVYEVSPAYRQHLNPAVLGPVAELGVECSKIGRVGVGCFDGLAHDIDIVNEVHALKS